MIPREKPQIKLTLPGIKKRAIYALVQKGRIKSCPALISQEKILKWNPSYPDQFNLYYSKREKNHPALISRDKSVIKFSLPGPEVQRQDLPSTFCRHLWVFRRRDIHIEPWFLFPSYYPVWGSTTFGSHHLIYKGKSCKNVRPEFQGDSLGILINQENVHLFFFKFSS